MTGGAPGRVPSKMILSTIGKSMSATHIHIHIHVHAKRDDEYPTFEFTKGKNYESALNPDSGDEEDVHYKSRGPKGRSEKPATWR